MRTAVAVLVYAVHDHSGVAAEFVEKRVINLIHGFRLHADGLVLKQLHQLFAVDQFDRYRAIAAGLVFGVEDDASGGDEHSFLGWAQQGVAKLAHRTAVTTSL